MRSLEYFFFFKALLSLGIEKTPPQSSICPLLDFCRTLCVARVFRLQIATSVYGYKNFGKGRPMTRDEGERNRVSMAAVLFGYLTVKKRGRLWMAREALLNVADGNVYRVLGIFPFIFIFYLYTHTLVHLVTLLASSAARHRYRKSSTVVTVFQLWKKGMRLYIERH